MQLRHAVFFHIDEGQERISNVDRLRKSCETLNEWINKKLSEHKKPIKSIKLISGEHDCGEQLGIGIAIELEE